MIQFSRRVPLDLEENQWTQFVRSKSESAEPILDLTVSIPTEEYCPDPKGLLLARNAIARDQQEKGIFLDPDRMWLTSGTSEAYSFLLKLLTDPEDEVLIPVPSYPLFDHILALEGVKSKPYRLFFDSRWKIDLESIGSQVGERTKALIVVHPNNPTGSFVEPLEIRKLIALCERKSLALIVDEVFLHYPWEPNFPIHSFSNESTDGLMFVLDGFSKQFGLPQMKISWIHAKGSAGLLSQLHPRLDLISDTFLTGNTETQRKVPELLARGNEIHSSLLGRIRKNRRTYSEFVSRKNLQDCSGQGGWNVIVRLPERLEDEQWARRLIQNAGVKVYPGYFFDLPFESSCVLSLLADPVSFCEALTKIDPLISKS